MATTFGATQLVETSEDDSFLAVAKFIADILDKDETSKLKATRGSALVEKVQSLLATNSHGELLVALLAAVPAVFAAEPAEADLACVTHILCHVAARAVAAAGSLKPADDVVACATSATTAAPARLAMLMSLYNTLAAQPAAQLRVLLAAMAYAAATGQADALAAAAAGKAETWAAGFGLSGGPKRELYVGIADLLRATGAAARRKEAFELSTKALALVQPGDSAGLSETLELAARTVRSFVCSPTLFQCDLASLPAVQQLEKVAQHATTYKVFKAMLNGDFAAFKALDIKQALEPGCTVEALTAKMGQMALLALCGKNLQKEMPFATVQTGLCLDSEDEVELAIVRAIAAKLIDARIDQLRRVVVVTRTTQQKFGDAEWQSLAADLRRWSANLADVGEIVRQQVLSTKIAT